MTAAPTPSYSAEHSFADSDQLASQARQWDLEFLQLDRGEFRGRLLQFGVGNVHISEARFERSLIQEGTPPAGLRTIGIPANKDVRFSWRGISIDSKHLLVFPRGSELSSVSNPDFHVYTCSIPEEVLGVVADSLGVDELDSLVGDTGVVRCTSPALDSVRRCLVELCETARYSGSYLSNDHSVRRATDELPRRLLAALSTSANPRSSARVKSRALALIRAEHFIERFACEDISICDIARAAQVSQRTLEYAFTERYGLTPKSFLMAYRLGALRQCLRLADPTRDKVSDIASRWGFWHMGQLAADYRKQFDELPSQTLRRVSV